MSRSGRYSIVMAGVLALALAMGACKGAPNDAELTSTVKTKLQAAAPLAGATIDVAVKEGVVTLTGNVGNKTAKDAAEAAAQGVPGVRSVTNNIAVKASASASPSAPSAAPAPPGNDAAIQKAVMSNLSKVSVTGVTVEVASGVVTLKGTVAKEMLQKAMQAANESNPRPSRVINEMNK